MFYLDRVLYLDVKTFTFYDLILKHYHSQHLINILAKNNRLKSEEMMLKSSTFYLIIESQSNLQMLPQLHIKNSCKTHYGRSGEMRKSHIYCCFKRYGADSQTVAF